MRARLVVIFTIPGVLLFLLLGVAYAASVARAKQQEMYLDRLSDAGYLVVTARQSLTAEDPSIVAGELERYGDVYGIGAAVLNQSGETWATNGLDVESVDERLTALAGRRSGLSESLLPWQVAPLVVAEPVFEGGDLIGAVVTASDTERLTRGIWLQWGTLLGGGVAALALAIVIASRLASWVLRPVRAVDSAMAEIGRGQLAARIPESTGPPELQQVIARFNQMAEKVEHLMHKQQEFVSNASHELRNPLNALLLRVEGLALALPDDVAPEIEHVRAEGQRMARIVDALLMLARDEDMAAGTEPVEVAALVARRVQGWKSIAKENDVELRLTGIDQAWGRADEIVLESAFDAVTDNAVKFSPASSTVEVSVVESDGVVEVRVRDHGPGLSQDEIGRVTDRFWRSPEHSRIRGSGLGLAIASELLDSCGGELAVSRPEDGGLLVTLRVPRHEEPA
ncbi:MAG TPA: HAMP domain-containing sensor histidine kinase [Jiangellaceae bacterium]